MNDKNLKVRKELIKAGNIVDFTPKRALLDLLTEQVDAMVNKQVKALLTAKLQS